MEDKELNGIVYNAYKKIKAPDYMFDTSKVFERIERERIMEEKLKECLRKIRDELISKYDLDKSDLLSILSSLKTEQQAQIFLDYINDNKNVPKDYLHRKAIEIGKEYIEYNKNGIDVNSKKTSYLNARFPNITIGSKIVKEIGENYYYLEKTDDEKYIFYAKFNIEYNKSIINAIKEKKIMGLSEPQKLLLNYLKSIGMEEEKIIATMIAVKQPSNTDKLIDYIVENQKTINQHQILHKALEISQEN